MDNGQCKVKTGYTRENDPSQYAWINRVPPNTQGLFSFAVANAYLQQISQNTN